MPKEVTNLRQADILQRNAINSNDETRNVIADLSVIVPTVGRPILKRCLHSIAAGSVLPARVIVVDQGENHEVIDWILDLTLGGLEIFHLHSSERSPASARNQGIEQVQTPFVAAIDDDCVAEKDWLEKMELNLHYSPTSIITGRLEPAGNGIPPTIVTSEIPIFYERPSIRILSPLASANMGFALDTASKIGLFDGNVSPAEDNDWAYRALKKGIPILYVPEIVVYHVHWRDAAQMIIAYRAYAWSQGAFYGKHLRQGDLSMILRLILSMLRGGRSIFYGSIKYDSDRQARGFATLTRLLPGVIAGLQGKYLTRG